jgi:solute carrier family 25 (adenine nucleotide translocator) protein 4/5/6/31
VRKTVASEGVGGFYKGAFIFSLGLILFRGTYFGLYDSLKVKTRDERMRWLASAFASYLSIVIGYPIDSVRRRLISSRGKYANSRACCWDIWKREGVRGFYLGWQMILAQSVGLATIFFFYDRLTTDYTQAIN